MRLMKSAPIGSCGCLVAQMAASVAPVPSRWRSSKVMRLALAGRLSPLHAARLARRGWPGWAFVGASLRAACRCWPYFWGNPPAGSSWFGRLGYSASMCLFTALVLLRRRLGLVSVPPGVPNA